MRRALSTSIAAAAILASSLGQADQVAFESVEQVLADLRSDPNVEFREDEGWLVAEGNSTIWTFTVIGHPAHPAVVERRVYEDEGSIRIGTRTICKADQVDCDQFYRTFGGEQVVEENSRSIAGLHIDLPGLSVSLADKSRWTLVRRSAVMLVLRENSDLEGASIVGTVRLMSLPVLDADRDFLQFVIDGRVKHLENDPRVESPQFSERLTSWIDSTCVEYEYRYHDVGAVLPDGSTTKMNFANNGLRC